MVPQRANVLRDGERKELPATELVVGDIILLETGDRVPADIRILECQGEARSVASSCACFLFSCKNTSLSPRTIEDREADFSSRTIFIERKLRKKSL